MNFISFLSKEDNTLLYDRLQSCLSDDLLKQLDDYVSLYIASNGTGIMPEPPEDDTDKLFHECPNCNWRCNCNDQPCSCCTL